MALLSMSTEYALRMLWYMSRKGEGGRVKMQDMCDEMAIPISFLPKITRKLKEKGIVGSCSGVNGGLYLKKSLSEITFLEVAECMEVSIKCNVCLEEGKNCTRGAQGDCPFRGFYLALQEHVETKLLSVTLADIINGKALDRFRRNEGGGISRIYIAGGNAGEKHRAGGPGRKGGIQRETQRKL